MDDKNHLLVEELLSAQISRLLNPYRISISIQLGRIKQLSHHHQQI